MVSCKKANVPKLCLLLVSLFLIFPGAMAQTVSFADPDATVHKDVYMYNSTGTLLGSYNTTSTGINLPSDNSSVFFVMKPQYSNPLEDPGTFLSNFIGWAQTNALSLVILGGIFGLLLKRF